jgi:hypothetical protein
MSDNYKPGDRVRIHGTGGATAIRRVVSVGVKGTVYCTNEQEWQKDGVNAQHQIGFPAGDVRAALKGETR